MPKIDVAAFLGITPMVGKESLPNEAARLAENCRLEGGDLESWNDLSATIRALTSTDPVLSIYRYGIASTDDTNFWFQWTTDVDVIKGPIDDDVEERTYWTGDGSYPKKTKADIAATAPPYPSNHYRLGIPAPLDAPIVAISGTATAPDTDPTETSIWGYTYVTTWDEEGPMSPLSDIGSWQPGQTPDLSGLDTVPTGPYSIDRKRIYRSASGTNETDMQFVAEIPVSTTTYSDSVLTENLGRIAETRLWTPPPDNIQGLCMMANEICAAFYDSTVALSVPGVPYAWPTNTRFNYDAPIVGIKPFGQSLLVCTQRSTHLLTGADPTAMSQEIVTEAGICQSKRGMVSMLDGVLYPVPLGLQYVGPGGPKLMTAVQFDERSWAQFKPTSFNASRVNNRYVAMYDTGTVQGSLIFSFVTPDAVVTSTVWGSAIWHDPRGDILYVVKDNNVTRWNGGAALTAKWQSKAFRFGRPINMAAASVEADTYPVTLKVYADGNLIHTETVADYYGFPLPAGDEWREYAFQYEGTTRISRVIMATSMIELTDNGE